MGQTDNDSDWPIGVLEGYQALYNVNFDSLFILFVNILSFF